MNVTFYINNSDDLKVRKSLTTIKTISCVLKDNSTVKNPVILLGKESLSNWARINYMYIDIFDRYYFIEPDSKAITGEMIEIVGRRDVLQSNANAIGNITCVVTRQENLYNMFYQDPELQIRAQKTFIYKSVGSLPNVKTYLLTVDGGKQ